MTADQPDVAAGFEPWIAEGVTQAAWEARERENAKIPDLRMDQTMVLMSGLVAHTISMFGVPGDAEPNQATMRLVALAVFLQQLTARATDKVKTAAMLRVVADDLDPPKAEA